MAIDFVNRVRIRYGECDMQGVAFNANYLVWVDDTMDQWLLAAVGPDYLSLLDYHVKKASVTWSAPARHGEVLELRPRVQRVGTTSFVVSISISVPDRPVAEAELVCVCVDSEHRPVPVPEAARAVLG